MGIVLLLLSVPITAFGLFACGYADSGPHLFRERLEKLAILTAGLALGVAGATFLGIPLILTVPPALATSTLGAWLVFR